MNRHSSTTLNEGLGSRQLVSRRYVTAYHQRRRQRAMDMHSNHAVPDSLSMAVKSPASSPDRHVHPSDLLRRVVHQHGYVAKPTAYAPYGNQEEHPLQEAHAQLQARLQAVREVRSRLQFVGSAKARRSFERSRSNNQDDDVEMADASLTPRRPAATIASMVITTRVALSTDPSTDVWMHDGGIIDMHGQEALIFRFLSAKELVHVSGVCQSWYAMARRNELWEPLLFTPVERYPLRQLMGFNTSGVPAIQVYIIYKKTRAQLQLLDAKNDDAPRQPIDTQRAITAVHRRVREQGANENNLQDLFEFRRPPGTTITTQASSYEWMRVESVHLVHSGADDLVMNTPVAAPAVAVHQGEDNDENQRVEEPQPPAVRHPVDQLHTFMEHLQREEIMARRDARLRQPVAFDMLQLPDRDPDSDEEFLQLHDDDMGELFLRDDLTLVTPVPIPAPSPPKQSTNSGTCRRVRLSSWLAAQRTVSLEVFRSFARQLLLALTTLELAQCMHSDICMSNIFVLDRRIVSEAVSASTTAIAFKDPTAVYYPLFQLYCRRLVNVWPVRSSTMNAVPPPAQAAARAVPEHEQPQAPRVVDHGMNQDRVTRLTMMQEFRRGMRVRLRARPAELAPPPPPPPPPPQADRVQVSQSPNSTMVRAFVRILREVWCHGRVVSTTERSLPFLMLLYQRSDLVTSPELRSFLEYAEALSTQEVSPSMLLLHSFFHDAPTSTTASTLTGSTVPTSPLKPMTFGSIDEYRLQAISWHHNYTRHLGPTMNLRRQRETVLSLMALPCFSPSTLLGPAFFHDALLESNLPYQRFVSVVAPATATSPWVKQLALTQRYTLQQLDLSHVRVPVSVLVKELSHLQRLTHLRLPSELLRDENLEQFVAAVWCTELLPSLQVMDVSVREAMDRMEAAYSSQLHIMASLLDPTPSRGMPRLSHTFSSPY